MTSNHTHTHVAICSSSCHPVGGYCTTPGQCLYVFHLFTSHTLATYASMFVGAIVDGQGQMVDTCVPSPRML